MINVDIFFIWKHSNSVYTISVKWPQLVSSSLKDKLIQNFPDRTSASALASSTYTSCCESCSVQSRRDVPVSAMNMDLIHFLLNSGLDLEQLKDVLIG